MSAPSALPFARPLGLAKNRPVARLHRAPDYESGGRTFESFRARQETPGIIGLLSSLPLEGLNKTKPKHAQITETTANSHGENAGRLLAFAMRSEAQMYDANGICWHQSGRFDERCRLDHHKTNDRHFYYGRCKSGRRWFWSAYDIRAQWDKLPGAEAHGWEDTEQAALDAARAAVVRIAKKRKAYAHQVAGVASERLKEINATKRAARPPSDNTESKSVEYLYSRNGFVSDQTSEYVEWVCRFPIIKKTAKRIYYSDADEEIDELSGEPISKDYGGICSLDEAKIGFVDRQELEANGEVCNRGRHWSANDYKLYASLKALKNSRRRSDDDEEIDLPKLKAAMAAAHPDRGGSNAAFIEARRAYVEAKRNARSQKRTA
jgi:hypothetical protein